MKMRNRKILQSMEGQRPIRSRKGPSQDGPSRKTRKGSANRRKAKKGKASNGKGSSKSLFPPDEISTGISQAIYRDLSLPLQEHGSLEPGLAYAIRCQRDELLKKYEPQDLDMNALEVAALQKWKAVNHYMARINRGLVESLPWMSPRINQHSTYMDKIHLRARAIARQCLGSLDEDEWFLKCKTSGGATVGVPFADTSPEAKFTYPMTTTVRVKRLFERYLEWNFQLHSAIEQFNRDRGTHCNPKYRIVQGTRATTVSKDARKRRTVIPEASCDAYMQQGLMGVMYDRLRAAGLDVETLPNTHKFLAQMASITGALATIDWSSASDSVSYELVRWLLPHDWFWALDICRSPNIQVLGEWTKAEMFSSMGNAGTFPLETLVFWAYAHAVILTEDTDSYTMFPEPNQLERRDVSVFGDDCIVPSEYAQVYMTVLEGVGFSVNSEKSYWGTERFRESCGGDYLMGYPTRPFSLKAPHSTSLGSLEPWLYVLLNSLIPKYIQYFGELKYAYGKDLWEYLGKVLDRYNIKIRFVPDDFPEDAGLQARFARDFDRLARCYGWKSSPLYRNQHGTYRFTMLKFQYKEKVWNSGAIRANQWYLRRTTGTQKSPEVWHRVLPTSFGRPEVPWRKRRKVGGYVVARAHTDRWSVSGWMPGAADRRH